MLGMIWNLLYNLKNVNNTHGEMLLLVKLQAEFIKSNTPVGCFSRFFKLQKNDTKSRKTSHIDPDSV